MRAKHGWVWRVALLPSRLTRLTRPDEQAMASADEQDAAVQAYVETMSALFLKQEVREATLDEEAQHTALAHTATVLRSFDVAHRATLIRFLSQSGLVLLGIGTDLQTLNLSGADLGHLTLGKVRLSEANLSHAKLMSGDLRGADLKGTNLRWADLRGADLSRAMLSCANLRGADLSGALLKEAYLGEADLSDADLSWADLRGAYLGAADLRGADLSGAALRDACVTQEQVHQARPSTSG